MNILDRRHVREETLAALASEEEARGDLSPFDRQHLEMCDRCSDLIEGHRLASRALTARWQYVTAGEVSTGRGVERVRGTMSGALGDSGRLTLPIAAVLAIVLISALVGTALLVGSSHPLPPPLSGVTDATTPSPLPTPPATSPTTAPTAAPTPVDSAGWIVFESPHYGYQLSRPPDWSSSPASLRWDLMVDQDPDFVSATDHFTPTRGTAMFAAYGSAIPDGVPADGFIEAYRAPNVAHAGVACFPPPSSWERVPVDGQIAGLAQGCGYIEAIVVVGRRIYIFSGYGALADDRPLFDAFLSTVRLHPETADSGPFTSRASPN